MPTDQLEWLRLLREEYLTEYIPQGGAAVKVVVVDPNLTIPLVSEIVATAANARMLHFHIQASDTRVDFIHEIFFAMSYQIDWLQWADSLVRRLLSEQGIIVREETELTEVESIAQENGIAPGKLREIARTLITNNISKDYFLAKDFRVVFSALCVGRMSPTLHTPDDCETLIKWLRGEKCDLRILKNLQVFQKIARHNARWMINSLVYLTKKLGNQGVVVTVDINSIFEDVDVESYSFKYTKSKTMDFYEVLRQFIDDIDNSSHLALIIVAPQPFVEDDKRCYKIYHALHTRLVDDVRDTERSNPLNALTVFSIEDEL
jgi:hypothetical protein